MTTAPTTNDRVEQLVSEHLYLVQHIVHQLSARYPRHVDRQELWSAGALGLVESAKRYDASSGVPFRHFAQRRIRGAMLDSTRSRDWASRSVRRNQRELAQAAQDFEQSHHRQASDTELADQLGIDVEEVARRRASAERSTLLHLDAATAGGADDQAPSLVDVLPSDQPEASPHGQLEQRELMGTIRVAVDQLPEPHRTVVDRYYLQEHLLRDIADDMQVTEARVSQVRAEAIHAIQSLMDSVDFDVPSVPTSAPGSRRRAAYVAAVSENSTWRQRLEAGEHVEDTTHVVDIAS